MGTDITRRDDMMRFFVHSPPLRNFERGGGGTKQKHGEDEELELLLLLDRPSCPDCMRIVGWLCSTPCIEAKDTLESVP